MESFVPGNPSRVARDLELAAAQAFSEVPTRPALDHADDQMPQVIKDLFEEFPVRLGVHSNLAREAFIQALRDRRRNRELDLRRAKVRSSIPSTRDLY